MQHSATSRCGLVELEGSGMWESGAVPDIFASDSSTLERSATLSGVDATTPAALKAKLREMISAEVLPRMFRNWAKQAQVDASKFARLLIDGRDDVFRREIGDRLAAGTPALAVLTEILAPTAREIGRLWENDDCDLFEVQRATGALKRWIIEIAPSFDSRASAKAPSILLHVAPGETHLLGVDMAAALFRAAGWRVVRGDLRGFQTDLAKAWRDVVGFSLSCDRHIEALAQAIVEAREASRNPKLLVLVGGPIFIIRPELAEKIGADLCASTAEITVQYAKVLLNGIKMSPLLHTRC
jgi:methanogenic corrinoid protein MtbC1